VRIRALALLGIVAGGPGVPQPEWREPVGVDVLGAALELGERRDGAPALGRDRVVDLQQQGLVGLDDQGAVVHLASVRSGTDSPLRR